MTAYSDQARFQETVAKVAQLPSIQTLIVAHEGETVAEYVFHGPGLDSAVNLRSASKSVVGALVGIAIDKGMIKGVGEPVLPLLKKRAPENLDPKIATITIHHLLSMRSGLERIGALNYDRWVQSSDWVSFALTQKFVDEPGGRMLYSTGNWHLLSAILTDVSDTSTWELVQRWLGEPMGITFPRWLRDPQGIYFGGDEMLLSPRGMLRFGEMYRNGGVHGAHQIVPSHWTRASWTRQTTDARGRVYGYGWFIAGTPGHPVHYAWGLGGQVLSVIPSLNLTIVMTAEPSSIGLLESLNKKVHDLVTTGFMPAAWEVRRNSRTPGLGS